MVVQPGSILQGLQVDSKLSEEAPDRLVLRYEAAVLEGTNPTPWDIDDKYLVYVYTVYKFIHALIKPVCTNRNNP